MRRKTKTILGMITIAAGSVIAFRRMKSYFKAKRGVVNLFAAAVCTLLCTSCSSTNGNASYKTSEEAVNAYATFLTTVKAKDNVSPSDLTTLAKDWRTTNDSVTVCLMRDTTMTIHGDWSRAYQTVHDSLRREFQRIVLSRPRTFADVVNLKATLSAYAEDEDLSAAKTAAMPFFASLDSVSIYIKVEAGGRPWYTKGCLTRLSLLVFIAKLTSWRLSRATEKTHEILLNFRK